MSAGIGNFVDEAEDSDSLGLKVDDSRSESSAEKIDAIDLKVTCVEYTDSKSGTTIHLFGRDESGERHHVEVDGHDPSFFISEEEYTDRVDNHYAVKRTETHSSSGERYTTLYDEPLVRVYTHQSSSVGEMRELFEDTYEADVMYDARWKIDNEIITKVRVDTSEAITDEPWLKGDMRVENEAVEARPRDVDPTLEPRITAFDIEVASESGFPSPDEADWPVSTIVAWDSYTEEYVGWLLRHEDHPPNVGGGAVLGMRLRRFSDESALLDDFHQWMASDRPDIITGWNSDQYDIPYLINRSKDLNVYSYQDWSPLGETWHNHFGPVVKGVECVDMMGAYEKTQKHDLDSKKLEAVASDELGEGKVPVVESHTEMWKSDPVEFLKYNKVDVELVHEINDSSGALDMLDHLRNIAGVAYSDLIGGAFEMMDMVFLRKAAEYGYRLPTAEEPDVGDFRGAWVYTPEPGLHEHCIYPDYACFTDGHEVMTPSGPRLVENMSVGDEIYTLDEETHELVRDTVADTHEYRHEGEVYSVEGTVGNFEVTPNHNLYVGPNNADPTDAKKFEKMEIQNENRTQCRTAEHTVDLPSAPDVVDLSADLGGIYAVCYVKDGRYARHNVPNAVSGSWIQKIGYENTIDGSEKKWTKYYVSIDTFYEFEDECRSVSEHVHFKSGTECQVRPTKFDSEDFVELISWFVSEGSLDGEYGIKIANEDGGHLDRVCDILNRHDIPYYRNDRGVSFTHGVLREWLIEYCGGCSKEKNLPALVFQTDLAEVALETLIDGDGCRGVSASTYYTSSEQLAEDVARLSVLCGFKPRIVERERSVAEYDIYIRNGGGFDQNNVETDEYSGSVHCITAEENHVVLAGRDGYFEWIGQSLYPHIQYQCNISPETLIGTKEDLEASEYTEDDCVWSYVDTETPPEQKEDVPIEDHMMERVFFLKPSVKEGFVRAVLDDIMGLADRYTGGMYEAAKKIRNASWGVAGDSDSYGDGFRLFDWRLAEATTLGGQKVLKGGADYFVDALDDPDAYVVGGDTDSYQTSLPNAESGEDALETAFEAAEDTNEWLDGFTAETFGLESASEARMELEIESYAPTLFYKAKDGEPTKKRYVQLITWNDEDGWVDDPSPKIKGFEYVRSDVAPITKDVQYETFEILLDDESDKEERIKEVGERKIEEVFSGDSDEKIGVPCGIGQALSEYGSPDRRPQYKYRGAKFANKFIYGTDAIGEGDKPLEYRIKEGQTGGDLRKTFDAATAEDGDYVDCITVFDVEDLPDDCVIDRPSMAKKTILSPMEDIWNTLGYGTEWAERTIEQATPPSFRRDEDQEGLDAWEAM